MQSLIEIPCSADMAIRNEQRELIRAEIQEQLALAIDAFRPHGWKKFANWLRAWSLTGTIITVFVALLALTVGAFYQSFAHVKEETEFRTHTNDRLKNIEGSLQELNSSFKSIRLKQLSENPSNQQNIASAKEILNQAISNKIHIGQEFVKSAGENFVEASEKSPNAWDAALTFLDYRSTLNAVETPPLADSKQDDSIARLIKTHVLTPNSETGVETWQSQKAVVVGELVSGNFALMEELDTHSSATKGYQFIVYEMQRRDNELLLDGLHLRNVIIKNTVVTYRGGAVNLENVYFVNCTFDLPSVPQTRNLATAILSSPAITFNKTA